MHDSRSVGTDNTHTKLMGSSACVSKTDENTQDPVPQSMSVMYLVRDVPCGPCAGDPHEPHFMLQWMDPNPTPPETDIAAGVGIGQALTQHTGNSRQSQGRKRHTQGKEMQTVMLSLCKKTFQAQACS